MEFKIQGKVCLVTGAASGIGAGVVKALLEEGAKHVAVLDVAEDVGLKLQNELNRKHGAGKIKFFKCDVTNENQLFTAFDETLKQQGCLDVVINNAGIMNDSKKTYKKEIEINVIAVVTGTMRALEIMRKDKGGQGGTVINISSIAGLTQAFYLPVYFATKSAVLQFTSCIGMGETFTRTGVRFISVCFGATDTPLLAEINAKSYDEIIDKELAPALNAAIKQKPESAVRGVIEAYKKGATSSTWLAYKDALPVDITQDIKDGYAAMARHMF